MLVLVKRFDASKILIEGYLTLVAADAEHSLTALLPKRVDGGLGFLEARNSDSQRHGSASGKDGPPIVAIVIKEGGDMRLTIRIDLAKVL